MARKTSGKAAKVAVSTAAALQKAASPIQGLTVAARKPCPAPENLAVAWQPKPDGTAELLVAYEGPLAGREKVLARLGTCRLGAPWQDVRDVELTRAAPGRFVAAVPILAAAMVDAVELAFRAGDDWDNGGRAPLGYYEWTPRERRVEVR